MVAKGKKKMTATKPSKAAPKSAAKTAPKSATKAVSKAAAPKATSRADIWKDAALAGTTAALMLVDRDLVITYVNGATQKLLREHEQAFKTLHRDFDASKIVGTCIDVFHKHPEHQRRLLADPRNLPHTAQIQVGAVKFKLYVTAVMDGGGNHVGCTLEWADVTELRKHEDNVARLTCAVEGLNTNLMMCDAKGDITFMNPALLAMFQKRESNLRSVFKDFDAHKLMGRSIDSFHRNPAHQRAILSDPSKLPFKANVKVAGLEFALNATGIFDAKRNLIGNAVEWVDVTEQMDGQRQIEKLIEQAAAGNLGERIDTHRYEGFMKGLGEGINRLLGSVVTPLQATISVMEGVSTGDLTQTMEGDYHGDFGALSDAVKATVGTLRTMVADLSQSAASISGSSAELARGNEDLSQRTQEQAAALEETAASLEELASTVSQNAENARHASQLAAGARQQAEKGGDVVGRAIGAMQAINASSKRIADIIGVIDEIAFQTNLLALNAAVEAARAGEHGRGFAVVAAEVRNLAGRSAAAAKEIKSLIQDSVEKVGEGTRLVNESGQTLTEIVTSSKKVSDIVAEIASASAEQTAGIDQVNTAVSQMDGVTQQNAALVEEAAATAAALDEQARGLDVMMARFKVSDEGPVRAAAPARAAPAAPARSAAPARTAQAAQAAPARAPAALARSAAPLRSTRPGAGAAGAASSAALADRVAARAAARAAAAKPTGAPSAEDDGQWAEF